MLLKVWLCDDGGNEFTWCPKWNDLRDIIERAIACENENTKARSEELVKFRKLFLDLVDFIDTRRPETKVTGE